MKRAVCFCLAALLHLPCILAQNFDWAGRMGGPGADLGNDLAVDAAGNTYVIGQFSETADFDPGAGTTFLTAVGSFDCYVQKLDAAGNLVWVQQFGGAAGDYGRSIAIDPEGFLCLVGYFSETADFDPGPNTALLTAAGSLDIFVQKLHAEDGQLVWVRQMGGPGTDIGEAIAVDSAGNIYTTGQFRETADFDPGPATTLLVASGGQDVFIQKLDADGQLVWVNQINGTEEAEAKGIAVAPNGDAYATGLFSGTADFDFGAVNTLLTSNGATDAFILKLDPLGNFAWVKQMGSLGGDGVNGIALDALHNVYAAGYFNQTVDFDPGPESMLVTAVGIDNAFVHSLDPQGNFRWVRTVYAPQFMQMAALAVDAESRVYATGFFEGTMDFNPGSGVKYLTAAGGTDVFIQQLDASGNFIWAGQMGGAGYDMGRSIAAQDNGNIYTSGYFETTTDFDPGPGMSYLSAEGDWDVFVQKLLAIVPVDDPAGKVDIGLNLYPNPASRHSTLVIDLPTDVLEVADMRLYDTSGRAVASTICTSPAQRQWDLPNIPAGTYLLCVSAGKFFGQALLLVE